MRIPDFVAVNIGVALGGCLAMGIFYIANIPSTAVSFALVAFIVAVASGVGFGWFFGKGGK